MATPPSAIEPALGPGTSVSSVSASHALTEPTPDAATLRRLIDEADASAALLARALDRLRERERRTNHASVHLQERLRVGAQLLQALQSQIDRLDESIRGRQRTLESLESRVALMLERAERLEHAIESAEVNLAVKTSRLGDVETSK